MEIVTMEGTETDCPTFNPKTISIFLVLFILLIYIFALGLAHQALKFLLHWEMVEILHFMLCLETDSSSVWMNQDWRITSGPLYLVIISLDSYK